MHSCNARHLRTFLSWLEAQGGRPEWAGRPLAEMAPHLDASIQGFYQRLKVSQASSGA